MSRRHERALLIVDPGACNPSGVAHAIIEACAEARAEGVVVQHDPAVRLMVYQLAAIAGMEPIGCVGIDAYEGWMAECRARLP